MMPPPRLLSTFHPRLVLVTVVVLASCLTQVTANVKSVQTYKQLQGFSQLVTSSTLAWETYTGDDKQLEYAVHGGKYVSEEEHYYPIYVCRAIMDGIYTSGHTEKIQQRHVCLVSMHMEVKMHHSYEVLMNKGHGGKLVWASWSKFSGSIPSGAVSAGQTDEVFVARYKVEHNQQAADHKHYGADYILGRYVPKDRLGKIIVSEGGREMEYEKGEVLTEVEPVRYELREIKINKWRTDIKVNRTHLGSAILENRDDVPRRVETVISYDYDKFQNWGVHDGVARGLPTKVYETGQSPHEIQWGLKSGSNTIDTKTASTRLEPGTALNVTLRGNYATLDAPYTATLVAYYAGNSDSISRKISATVQKFDMQDIQFEFSPVYWIENGTMLPTTTTTTTTTTTEPTTTSTREPEPVDLPPVVHVSDTGRGMNNIDSNDIAAVAASKKKPNDMEDMQAGNSINGDAVITNTGDSLKLTNPEQNPEAKDGANSQQQQSLVILFGSCLMTSYAFWYKRTTLLN